MVSQSPPDDVRSSKSSLSPSRSSSSSSIQPQETGAAGDGSSSRSGNDVGLPDMTVELTGNLQHDVRMRSDSNALSLASQDRGTVKTGGDNTSQVQEAVIPSGSNTPQLIDTDVHSVDSIHVSKKETEDQQNNITMQFDSDEIQAPDAALLQPQSTPRLSLPTLEARRSFEEGTRSAHPGPRSVSAQGWFGSFEGNKSANWDEDDRRSHMSRSGASSPALHSAWSETNNQHAYRHIVTGEIFYHSNKQPEKPGPSADDIPEGWTARLVSDDEEIWEFRHRSTGTIIDVPPKSLPEAVRKEFDVAASYGDVPRYCQGQLEGDHIEYKITNPSALCPTQWRTRKHPKIIEDEMKEYLANTTAHTTRPPQVTLMTQDGNQESVDLETRQLAQMSGILVVTDINYSLISRLCANDRYMPLMLFFITCHFMLRTLHEDAATKELVGQIQGWFWMSERSDSNNYSWEGRHHDVMYDEKLSALHFGFEQYPDSYLTAQEELDIVRLSTFDVSRRLTIVLIGPMKPNWNYLQDDDVRKFTQPAWWLPAVPAYLGANQTDVRKYLIRLLQAVAQDIAALGLPRIYDSDIDQDLENCHELYIPYRLVMSTWKDGVQFLIRETDYFWEQAIKGPDVNDFTRLKASKRYAQTLYEDLGAWMVKMEGLLAPKTDRGGARAWEELKDVLGQIQGLKQEIGDTFQLLIGAIAIKDSEIQKKLARESRVQARRSTALTALAAIYLPLSLTTGVFGMNTLEIEKGVPKYWAVLAMGIGLLVITLPFLIWIFLDKDDQDEMRDRLLTSSLRGAEGRGRVPGRVRNGEDDDALGDSDAQSVHAKPFPPVRRRTTRFSQASWVGSRSSDFVRTTQPRNMV